jgi:hypothetical protein
MQSQTKDGDGGIVIERDVLVWLSVGCEALAFGDHCIFISPSPAASAVVQVEHRLPSVGPQLQALACTHVYACRLEHFSIWYDLKAPWPFTDCGLVNLVRALVQGSIGPVSVGRVKAQQGMGLY